MERGEDNSRRARVGDQIRQELMNMILRGEVKDPRAQSAVVHRVELSPDLKYAKVFVRLLEPDANAAQKKEVVKGLTRAGAFLRSQIARRLKLRFAPELRFSWDDSTEKLEQMEALLHEIRSDNGSAGEEE